MFDRSTADEQAGMRPVAEGLDDMAPGPLLGIRLSAIDVNRVSAYHRVEVMRAHDRMVSYHQAQRYAAMTAIADAYEEFEEDAPDSGYWSAGDGAATEIRAALHLTRRAGDMEMMTAIHLCRRLPAVWQALCDGRIDGRRARVIDDATCHLSEAEARDVAAAVLEHAPESTTGQLWARIRRLCISRNPEESSRRYERTVAERRVGVEPTAEGTANLCGWDLPPDRVAAISRWINRAALAIKTKDDTRTLTQIRADNFLDLLEHRCPARRAESGTGAGRPVVDIRVDLATLAGLSNAPGDLEGYGPVIADIARRVATAQPEAEWRYTVSDDRGAVLATGTTRRRPSHTVRRSVQLRDGRCVFPACRMPATSCDIDHIRPWAEGGPTTAENGAPLCRHDHVAKHHGWRYHRTDNGDYRWVSPLGHTYTTTRHPP